MIALVTGASSGIGRDIARSLAKHGINVIITARRRDRLAELKEELIEKYGVKVMCIGADLSKEESVFKLYNAVKKYNIDILINNAGFGVFGEFTETSLERELEMLNVNVKAFHILFKLFLRDFKKRGCGYILNTASVAGFMPGPHFSSYYASKAYIVRMTQAIAEELRAEKSGVHVSALCPGPVSTEFSETARVKFLTKPANSAKLAEHAVRSMFAGKLIICDNPFTNLIIALVKLSPDCLNAFAAGLFQSKRERF